MVDYSVSENNKPLLKNFKFRQIPTHTPHKGYFADFITTVIIFV